MHLLGVIKLFFEFDKSTTFFIKGHAVFVKKMLRSIFSLIQNIIDSDKEYNNTKSNTVIYLASNPDHTVTLDMEIDGQKRRNIKSITEGEKEQAGTFTITTDQGDTVTYKHFTEKQIQPQTGDVKVEEKDQETEKARTSFYNEADDLHVTQDESQLKTEPHGEHRNKSVDDFIKKFNEKQTSFIERGKY